MMSFEILTKSNRFRFMVPLSVQHQLQALSAKKRPVVRIVVTLLTLACALFCALMAWEIWASRRDRLADAAIATSNMARVLALHAETTMKAADLVLEDVVEHAEQDDWRGSNKERLRRRLETISEKATELHGLFVYDEHGEWIATSLRRPVKANNSDREYFKYHKSSTDRNVRIGEPVRSRSTGLWIIPVSRRVEYPDRSFAGIALATIKLDFFERAYSKLDVGKTGTVLLALDNGTLYYRRPFTEEMIGRDISSGPLMQFYRKHGPAGTSMLTAKIDSIERLYSYRHLDGFPLIVAVAVSTEEIFLGWWTGIIQLAGALIFFIAVLTWLGKKLLHQLAIRDRLEQQLHLVSNGLVQANSELSALAFKDGLTGLANRRAFDDTLRREYARAKREQTPVSLMMLDVDHFKKFNDNYGHPEGDACLQLIANAISGQVTRGTDFAARYGGEEFVVLLPGTELDGATAVAERIRKTVAELNIPHVFNLGKKVTVSIGVATVVPTHHADSKAANLLTVADLALYKSKSLGRNRVNASTVPAVDELDAA